MGAGVGCQGHWGPGAGWGRCPMQPPRPLPHAALPTGHQGVGPVGGIPILRLVVHQPLGGALLHTAPSALGHTAHCTPWAEIRPPQPARPAPGPSAVHLDTVLAPIEVGVACNVPQSKSSAVLQQGADCR